jgi:hypothetical protein
MSGDFEYDDEYTSTIDDNLTHGKVVISSLSEGHVRGAAAFVGDRPPGGDG